MTTPPDSGQNTGLWQSILAATAAAFLALSAKLMSKSGSHPRPTHECLTKEDTQNFAAALQGIQVATEAIHVSIESMERKIDRHGAIMEDHGRRLNRIEIRSEGASA